MATYTGLNFFRGQGVEHSYPTTKFQTVDHLFFGPFVGGNF